MKEAAPKPGKNASFQQLSKWRQDIQHNNTWHNNIRHNNIRHNNPQHNETQHNDTQHNGLIARLSKTLLSITGLIVTISIRCTQPNDTQHLVASLLLCYVSLLTDCYGTIQMSYPDFFVIYANFCVNYRLNESTLRLNRN
jgi:hypothetical protein